MMEPTLDRIRVLLAIWLVVIVLALLLALGQATAGAHSPALMQTQEAEFYEH